MKMQLRQICLILIALFASFEGQANGLYFKSYIARGNVFDSQAEEFTEATFFLEAFSEIASTEYNLGVQAVGSDSEWQEKNIDAVIQWTWLTDANGGTVSETAIVRFSKDGNRLVQVFSGLLDPHNEITRPVESSLFNWQNFFGKPSDNNYFTPNDNGPGSGNFNFDDYAYVDPSTSDGQRLVNGYRYDTWQLFRKEPMNELNRISIGFFYYSNDDSEPAWKSFTPARLPEDGTYFFTNYYGFDQELVWLLFFSSLFLNLTSVFSIPLVTIPMFWLMCYQLFQPITFAVQNPDKVFWTDDDYWFEVVLLQFGLSSSTYACMFFAWLIYIGVIIEYERQYTTTGSASTSLIIYGFAAGGTFQLIVSAIAGLVSIIFYFTWYTPAELRDL